MFAHRFKFLAPAILAVLAQTGSPAFAEDKMKGATIVIAKGTCVQFTFASKDYPCKAVIYTHFNNGRTLWQLPIPDGTLMLAGSTDSQPDPTKYILQIDQLDVTTVGNNAQPVVAKGVCTSSPSADGKYLNELSCSVTSAKGDAKIEFKGDGTPVDIKTL